MKQLLLAACMISLVSCSDPLAFEIGQSRESVEGIITNKIKFIEREGSTTASGQSVVESFKDKDHITLYDFKYKGNYYYILRTYYRYNKVRKMEISVLKEFYPDFIDNIISKYGKPKNAFLPYGYIFPQRKEAKIWLKEKFAIVYFTKEENDERIDILVLSGKDKEELADYIEDF